jgi:hypothetical protein
MNLTRKTFYKNLAKYSNLFVWNVDKYGPIRGIIPGTLKTFCPITAVCYAIKNIEYGLYHSHDAAYDLNIDYDDAYSIAMSADGDADAKPNQRKAILKHTGLES